MSKITITPELIGDLKKFGTNFCVGMASYVRDELDLVALSTIAAFYSHYEPTSYIRNGYNLVNNIHEKYYANPHGGIIRGGVKLSSEKMDNIYRGSTDNVYNSVINGFHGYVSNFLNINPNATIPPVMSPSPLKIVEDKRDSIAMNINQYQQYGYSKAKADSYSTFI